MPKFRITFTDGPEGDLVKNCDVVAADSHEALRLAYKMPEAKQTYKYTNVTVREIEDGPKLIGVCFWYKEFGKQYCQYLFIRANDEDQAIKYYKENIMGKRFYQPWPDKPSESGNCVYGEIKYTYFADGLAGNCKFDAISTT